jgi:hypothetical protein
MENIREISLTEGCQNINTLFNLESDFENNLIPKLQQIIKEMYGVNIINYQKQKHYKNLNLGYFNIFVDLYLETDGEYDIVIECKNPKQTKVELFHAFSQIMSYEFLFEKMPKSNKKVKFVLATSRFDFLFFEFMKRYNITFDVILNNKNTAGYWINDL